MREGSVNWQMNLYGGTVHSFSAGAREILNDATDSTQETWNLRCTAKPRRWRRRR
jgi:hypothetical protein